MNLLSYTNRDLIMAEWEHSVWKVTLACGEVKAKEGSAMPWKWIKTFPRAFGSVPQSVHSVTLIFRYLQRQRWHETKYKYFHTVLENFSGSCALLGYFLFWQVFKRLLKETNSAQSNSLIVFFFIIVGAWSGATGTVLLCSSTSKWLIF